MAIRLPSTEDAPVAETPAAETSASQEPTPGQAADPADAEPEASLTPEQIAALETMLFGPNIRLAMGPPPPILQYNDKGELVSSPLLGVKPKPGRYFDHNFGCIELE
jgi:hypothetical protein